MNIEVRFPAERDISSLRPHRDQLTVYTKREAKLNKRRLVVGLYTTPVARSQLSAHLSLDEIHLAQLACQWCALP